MRDKRRVSLLKAGDLILLILILGLITVLSFRVYRPGNGESRVEIRQENKVWIYPLSEEKTLTLDTPTGPLVISIHDGKASIIEAHCPEKICLHSPPISRKGEGIVCLPSRVALTIISGEQQGEEPDENSW